MHNYLIDTHAHLDGDEFKDDLTEVILRAKETNVKKIFIPNINATTLDRIKKITIEHEGVLYPMIGLHPEDVNEEYVETLNSMETELQHPHNYIGIGEIGLDYYWDDSMKEQQKKAFARQVEWGVKYNLPLMIHTRSAHKDMIDIMHEAQSKCGGLLKGVFHCFAGTVDEAREMLAIDNFMIGIGGIATFKKSQLPETIKEAIPLSKIVLETDSPYMAPVPHRGKRNESAFVDNVADKLAEIFGCTKETVVRQTTENALSVFRI